MTDNLSRREPPKPSTLPSVPFMARPVVVALVIALVVFLIETLPVTAPLIQEYWRGLAR